MKKTIIVTVIVVCGTFLLLYIFNRITANNKTADLFVEVKTGEFEISVSATGELIAERSLDIKGPEFATGRDIHGANIKISDLIAEGTLVKEGDYVATLDRTELNNSLKDESERLKTLEINLEMKLLDTAVVLNDLRDGIKNQKFRVEEAAMTFRNSKFEPPTTLRQAEIELDKSQRVLEQVTRSYKRRLAQVNTDIYNQKYWISRVSNRVKDLKKFWRDLQLQPRLQVWLFTKKSGEGTKEKPALLSILLTEL